MRIYFDCDTTSPHKYNVWMVAFTPCLYLSRHDVFYDEAAYYLSFVWLIFRIQIIFTRKKKTIPTGACNISVGEQ